MNNSDSIAFSFETNAAAAGLTKREWFAGQALAGMASAMAGGKQAMQIADLAVSIADAVLAKLEPVK